MSDTSLTFRIINHLPKRKREVLTGLAAGRTTQQIAGDLNISPKTVEYHRLELMESVDLHSYAELTRFAIRLGLAELDV